MKNEELKLKHVELGQAMFGGMVCEYHCPEYLEALIEHIINEFSRVYGNVNQKRWDEYRDATLGEVEYHAFTYNDDDERPNLKYGGVEVCWYKHVGRGMSVSASKTPEEWIEWFNSCIAHLRNIDGKSRR